VDPAQADALIARADAAYAARMQTFPEATWGHALDHALAWGDPADALDMALANATLRPHGAPQIQLAQAWLLHDDPARALDALTPALDAGWASADLHVVAADAHHALGDADAAHAHCAQAQALNPSASCSQR
jgi:predicted Zn-dependent protease